MTIEITKVTYTANNKEYVCELEGVTPDRLERLVLIDFQRRESGLIKDCPSDLTGLAKDKHQLKSYGVTINTVEKLS
ncbi:hypothetical protein [Photobacterium damselae]|uniref:hypothetical protein n=1 Tax=Photobacterium damselae TaxID=38293 RepID=UPI00406981F8